MKKPVFVYTEITSQHEDEEYGIDFEFQPSEKELTDKLSEVIYDNHFWRLSGIKAFCRGLSENNVYKSVATEFCKDTEKAVLEGIKEFLEENDLAEVLADRYYAELREAFREQAFEEYEDVR